MMSGSPLHARCPCVCLPWSWQHVCLVASLRVSPLTLPLCPRYGTLLELGEKRKDMLEKSCKKFMLFREANELQQWIHEKESALTNEEVGSDLEQVEVLQKKFDDFQKVTPEQNQNRASQPRFRPGSDVCVLPACPGPEGQRVPAEGHQQGGVGAGV